MNSPVERQSFRRTSCGKEIEREKNMFDTMNVAKIIKQKGPMGIGQAIASVDGKVVAKAELTFMVG